MQRPEVTPWTGPGPADEETLRAVMEAEGLVPRRWSNGPGDRYAPHDHPYHKVLYCVSGSITFEIVATGERVTLRAGDRLDLPAGVVHAALVGPEGVVCIEAPRR
ncbi:MAG TPA: cupin domain-containing protein [Dehalococcoidia bacterium]|nr:cupin domain-containing protein [Dehalococcoidia bacterium]